MTDTPDNSISSTAAAPAIPSMDAVRFNFLLETLLVIAQCREFKSLKREIAKTMRWIFNFDRCLLVQLNGDGSETVDVLLDADATGGVEEADRLLIDQANLTGQVQRSREKEQQRTRLCLPLTVADRRIGVIFFSAPSETAFGRDEVVFAQAISSYLAITMEHIRQRNELVQQTDELEQANKRLEYEQFLMQTLMDNIPDPVFFKDRESRFIRANNAMAHDGGFDDPLDLIGKTDAEIWSGDLPEQTLVDEQRIMETGVPIVNKEEMPMLEGADERWVSVTKLPLRDESGEIVGTFGIARDITELKLNERLLRNQAEELARSNDQLARSNQDLDDFAYIASHDLKEPLRGIANYAQFIGEDYAEKLDEAGQQKLDTMRRLCQRMEDLIDSLLKYSRVGRAELAVKPTDLNEVLAEVLDSIHVTLEEQNVEVRIPSKLPTVRCDTVRVGELFRNLITNAVKYNDKSDKWVEIGVQTAGEQSSEDGESTDVFYVRDNGIGIREKQQESVFRIFRRLHGRDKYGGGTGAGLTFAKKIVERHDGKIWLESTVGEGTTFYFTLQPM